MIYVVEAREPFSSRVRTRLVSLTASHPRMGIAVGRLTWMECRVGPIQAGQLQTLARYDAFFDRPDLTWVELDRDVVEVATHIRARHGLRTPDALQAASCLQLGPEHVLLTGAKAFRRVPGLTVEVLE